jgi:hypothetical protein
MIVTNKEAFLYYKKKHTSIAVFSIKKALDESSISATRNFQPLAPTAAVSDLFIHVAPSHWAAHHHLSTSSSPRGAAPLWPLLCQRHCLVAP